MANQSTDIAFTLTGCLVLLFALAVVVGLLVGVVVAVAQAVA